MTVAANRAPQTKVRKVGAAVGSCSTSTRDSRLHVSPRLTKALELCAAHTSTTQSMSIIATAATATHLSLIPIVASRQSLSTKTSDGGNPTAVTHATTITAR